MAASRVAASSRSASAATITGVALPSSRLTRLRGARSRILQPTAAEPVKVMSATRSSSTRTSPISAAFPQTTFSQPGGSPASVLELREQQRRERRLRRRLQHDRAARGEGRRDLVGDEVEGEVERRDGSDDSDRNPQRERDLPDAGGRRVHRDDVSGELPGLDRRHRERRGRARRLDAGGLDRLPCLGRDRPRHLVRALVHEPSRPLEDRGPLVGRKRLRQRSLGGVDCAPRDARVALRDAARRSSRRRASARRSSRPSRSTRHRRGASARSRSSPPAQV